MRVSGETSWGTGVRTSFVKVVRHIVVADVLVPGKVLLAWIFRVSAQNPQPPKEDPRSEGRSTLISAR